MNKAFLCYSSIAFALALILANAGAANIIAPTEVPSFTNWSFSVELNSTDSFTKTEIYLDEAGIPIVTAFNNSSTIYNPAGSVLKAFALDNDPNSNAGLTLYVSVIGLNEGAHNLKILTYNGSNLNEEKSLALNSIQVLSKEFQGEMENKISSINSELDSKSKAIDELKTTTESSLQQKTQEINSLNNSVTEVASSVESTKTELQQKISTETASLEEDISKIESKNKQQDTAIAGKEDKVELQGNPLVGMIVMGKRYAWIAGVLVVIIIALFAFIKFSEKRGLKDELKIYDESFKPPKPPKRPFEGRLQTTVEEEKELDIKAGDIILKPR
ncbi:MAG: hypothetical protein AB1467_06905 [Candidatus Diapherotrites archaeon]